MGRVIAGSYRRPPWARFRDAVRALARGFEPLFPLARVVAWGCDAGPACDDTAIAESRGLVRVHAAGLRNAVYALPARDPRVRGHVLKAAVAAGGHR